MGFAMETEMFNIVNFDILLQFSFHPRVQSQKFLLLLKKKKNNT